VTADLIDLARAGDEDAFRRLVGPYERELRVHCYRMLGSVQDAEDAMQDALLAAWQGLGGFEGRATVRTWLYRVTTSRCLNVRRSARRRQGTMPPGPTPPEPTRLGEVTWLEPCPDDLLEGLRAALILRDVLGFAASEAARILGTTEESVTSALKRARATLRRDDAASPEPPPPDSVAEKQLVERLTRAYESGDVDGIIALFADDAWLTMPPAPLEYQGHGPIARFLTEIAFRDGRTYRLVPTRANGQLAFAAYLRETAKPEDARANGLLVLTLRGDRIQAMTRFTRGVLPRFGGPLP
jgi:RNA polymerase sigma-70 factor (ECF subfamily)